MKDPFKALKNLQGKTYYYALDSLGSHVKRLPVSIRVMLESLLRNCDGVRVTEEHVRKLSTYNKTNFAEIEVPFVVARVLLQDFTGVPLLVDLAAMRNAVASKGFSPEMIEPHVPVDLVIDHSVQVDRSGTEDSFLYNLELEFDRNQERYAFLKWGQEAFKTFQLVPPGIGICHQVNLERIATVVCHKIIDHKTILFPDTLVGTDSHTTMINGLGVVGWGVGGIEAEAAMLGQPYFLQAPEVVGFHLKGSLKEGVTATDLTLRITEILRKEKVVGKFVEFFGEGAERLPVVDRATIGNMAPEYGATMGFFPVDEKTLTYLRTTGRSEELIQQIRLYLEAQGLFGTPKEGDIAYPKIIELDLSTVRPCVAGPKRPQDRIDLSHLQKRFNEILEAPLAEGGYGKTEQEKKRRVGVHSTGVFSLDEAHESGGTSLLDPLKGPASFSEAEMVTNRPLNPPVVNPGYREDRPLDLILKNGSIVIAAITSCTNTSNPSVMLGAGLLAKKAVQKGLKVNAMIKTSLAPGSRVVTDYLEKTGLQSYLDTLGFNLVAYGCTTCIGNSGPLDQKIEKAIKEFDLVTASVLSGNRNFEARIHGSVKANFLMSPPLVIAFAIAGRVDIDFEKEPLGHDSKGYPVYLRDIWPTSAEIAEAIHQGIDPHMFKRRYGNIAHDNPMWQTIEVKKSALYSWDPKSTYIQCPPYFERFELGLPDRPSLSNMRPLAILGDSVTTDHISPAGAFKAGTPAGKYLLSQGVSEADFNSFGSRRGNHFVMMRGTFANVRIRNQLADGKEGGFTKLFPEGKIVPIFEASEAYQERNTPLIIFAGKDYGMGSSRDWAAKGTALLGVRAVVATSFERIHRSNLIGMGVLPLEIEGGLESLQLTGDETFSILGLEKDIHPKQDVILEIDHPNKKRQVTLRCRLDSSIEVAYYLQGGILPYVLRQICKSTS